MRHILRSSLAVAALGLAFAGSASAQSFGLSLNIPLDNQVYHSNNTMVYGSPGSSMTWGTQVPQTVCEDIWHNGFVRQSCSTQYVYQPYGPSYAPAPVYVAPPPVYVQPYPQYYAPRPSFSITYGNNWDNRRPRHNHNHNHNHRR